MCASCASQTNFLNHLRNEFDLRLSEMKSVRDEKRDEDRAKEERKELDFKVLDKRD